MPLAASIAGWYFYLSAPRPPPSHLQPPLYASVSLSRRLYRHLTFFAYKLTLKFFSDCRASESLIRHTYVQDGAFRATEHAYNASVSLSAPLWRELAEWAVKLSSQRKTAYKPCGDFIEHITFRRQHRNALTGCQRACNESLHLRRIN